MRYVTHVVLPSLLLLAMSSGTAVGQTPVYGYEIIKQYPHDTSAFTEGLVLTSDAFYESTGLNGSSSLRQVDLQTGTVLRQADLETQYFGEGMTIFQGKIFLLTWQSQTGFVYDPATFVRIGQFFYTGEGWGLTHDDQYLIMSDGTNQIRFLDPVTFQTVRSIGVYDDGAPVMNINELEYINGEIYANIWITNRVARIDPVSGRVVGWIDFTGLPTDGMAVDVFNGIAYDEASGHLLVTGKFWPWLFEVRLLGSSSPVAENQTIAAQEDTAQNITLSANDVNGDPLTFTIVAGPTHGVLSGAAPFLTYTPSPNYNGGDSFTFTANDGVSSSNLATVSLVIAPVNDAPLARDDAYATAVNATLAVSASGVLSNDSDIDGDVLAAVVVSAPAHGSLTLNANGSFTYTPSANFSGADAFTYAARDASAISNVATASITVSGATVALSPSGLSFGSQVIGTTSVARTVTLTNTSTGVLAINSITIIGAQAGDFAQTNSCGSSVAPGAACSISVSFRPTAPGLRKGAVAITSNAAGSPDTVTLSGTGKKGR